jgi:hypothetical protein
MKKSKKNKEPFHIVNRYKQYTSTEGYSFWAKDEEDGKLYLQHMGWELDTLKEVSPK